jgi:hypothetical protein
MIHGQTVELSAGDTVAVDSTSTISILTTVERRDWLCMFELKL